MHRALLTAAVAAVALLGVACVPEPAPATTTTTVTPASTAAPTTASSSIVIYKDCDAVREAGAAPLYRDQPGYEPRLDRDDDGVACET